MTEFGLALATVNIKLYGIFAKYGFIVIGSGVVQHHFIASEQLLASQFHVFNYGAAHLDKRGVVAQYFINGHGDFIGIVHQILELIWVFHQ